MDIYHTKKQSENIPPSCSYLLLKTLFYLYRSVLRHPILKVACVNLMRSWITATLHLFSQEPDL